MQRLNLFLPALLFSACVGACGQVAPKADTPAPQGEAATPAAHGSFDTAHAGTAAPDLPLETGPDGKTQTVADIIAANPGKPVLVNLWATWCAPCIKELKTLDTLAGATQGRLVVVPISQDMEGWQAVTPMWEKQGLAHLQTRLESKMQFGFALKAKGLPLSILYDGAGKEVWRYAGDRDWNDSESRSKLGI